MSKQITLGSAAIHSTPEEHRIPYDEPIIHLVDNIIKNAIQQNTSDIHIEPGEHTCRIRYRRDGILFTISDLPMSMANQLISRCKVIAHLDISERRLPQDGRFYLFDRDIRINTCPTLHGEKIVLRILTSENSIPTIDMLGMTHEQKSLFIQTISQPQGLILMTGPTGSGKTISLYSALHYLNTSEKNISTIEDPIEIKLNGVNQTQINTRIELHFSTILRTLLRQDPDIIMVGEIRDEDTATLAIQASQTGHLVLSSLHTNSAIDAITRLKSMTIATYHLCNSISLIIAQRLIRILCPHCKQREDIETDSLSFLPFNYHQNTISLYKPTGCQRCLHGFKGRTAIYELFPITSEVQKILLSSHYSIEINNYLTHHPFFSLKQAALVKLLAGETSLGEITRVLQR